jgi:hypothetical protein
MSSDVKAKKITATGALAVGPARIKGLSFVQPGTPGSIVVRDGGATGAVLLDLDLTSTSTSYIDLPHDGIRSVADPHLTLTVVTSVTVIYA